MRLTVAYSSEVEKVDLAQLAALFRTVGWDFRASDPVKLAEMVAGSRFVESATVDGRLVGFARAISDGVTNAYVSTVAVFAEWRGQGIGTELVRRLMEGRPGIRFVLHARKAVHPFYARLGFEPADEMLVRPRLEDGSKGKSSLTP
jgi:GNAT superfamily N-acetyltransferase